MKLDYLREFLVLGNTLNYSAAAKQLFITQPSLSKHIARLEEELGVRLFVRDTHNVSLTDAGKTCLAEVRDIVDKYDRLLKTMEASNRGLSGVVKLGFLNYTMGLYVSPVIERIEALYPNMTIEPYPSSPNEIIENLTSGKIDIGLFMHVPLPQEDLCQFDHLSIEDLRDETFLCINEPYQEQYESAIRSICMLHGFRPKESAPVPNLEAAVLAVQRSKGIYLLPRSAKTWNLPNVTAIDITNDDCYLYGCAAYRKSNENPAVPLVIKEYDRLMHDNLPR